MHLLEGYDRFCVGGLWDDVFVEKLDHSVAYGAELALDFCFEGGAAAPPSKLVQ